MGGRLTEGLQTRRGELRADVEAEWRASMMYGEGGDQNEANRVAVMTGWRIVSNVNEGVKDGTLDSTCCSPYSQHFSNGQNQYILNYLYARNFLTIYTTHLGKL